MLDEGEGHPDDNGNKLEIKDLTEIIHEAIS
jgi:hypothetical protein